MSDPEVLPLLAGLEQEYMARYGSADEMRRTREHEFEPPDGMFVVVVEEATTVAGGGFRRHSPDSCEVKRMWTHPDHRRRGLADRVLTALEDGARDAGYSRLVLETGPRQPEAAALYERRGYSRIPTYGLYPQALAFGVSLTAASERNGQII